MKFQYENKLDDLRNLDVGCVWVGTGRFKKHKEIVFDNDKDGNARFGWVTLRTEKDHIYVYEGDRLLPKEKNKKWNFSDYNRIEELTDDISEFTYNYFRSFVTVRKVGKKLIEE